MTLPVFNTVVGPVATNLADGATNYNAVASATEVNYDKWNAWLATAEASFTAAAPVTGASLVTAATGWALDTYAYRICWGRKWGGITFIALSFLRTGASITVAVDDGGYIGGTLIGTMATGWRPPDNDEFAVSACYGSYSPCQCYIRSDGQIWLRGMSDENIPFNTARTIEFTAMFHNHDVVPYP